MDFTHEDFQKGKRIGEAIQEFLLRNGIKEARSTDVYEMLAKKELIEKDRHQGLHFRKFLQKLKDANVLTQVIPQCTHSTNDRGENEWRFHLSAKKVGKRSGIEKEAKVLHQPAMGKEDLLRLVQGESASVESLPVRTDKIYTPQENSIKKNYSRAYEYWTKTEYQILDRVYRQCKNVDVVAGLLKRQPHIVKEKLEARGLA